MIRNHMKVFHTILFFFSLLIFMMENEYYQLNMQRKRVFKRCIAHHITEYINYFLSHSTFFKWKIFQLTIDEIQYKICFFFFHFPFACEFVGCFQELNFEGDKQVRCKKKTVKTQIKSQPKPTPTVNVVRSMFPILLSYRLT